MGNWQFWQCAGFFRIGAFWTTQLTVRLPYAPVPSVLVLGGPGCDASPILMPLPMARVCAALQHRIAIMWVRVGGCPVVLIIHMAMVFGVVLVAAVWFVWRVRGMCVLRRLGLRFGLPGMARYRGRSSRRGGGVGRKRWGVGW